jgi:hypothetical protein
MGSNGHKGPIMNPAIKRMMAEKEQQQNLTQQMFIAIPGVGLGTTMEGIMDMPTPDGKHIKIIKQMWAMPSGPVVALMDIDFAEAVANSMLEKVREARSGLTVVKEGPGGGKVITA